MVDLNNLGSFNLGSIGGAFQSYGYIILGLFIFGIIVLFGVFLFMRLGTPIATAMLALDTHGGGIRWRSGVIRKTRGGKGKFKYHYFDNGLVNLFRKPIQVTAPQSRYMAQLNNSSKVIFLKYFQTPDGKTYTNTINYYNKFTVPPSSREQTYEFIAPVNETVMSFQLDELTETYNKYPFLMKHPHIATAGVIIAGIIACMAMVMVINVAK